MLKVLELRVPPAIQVALAASLIYLINSNLPSVHSFRYTRYILSGLLIFTGSYLSWAGVKSFRENKTTINPMNPKASSKLVVKGVYSLTRNPMYLGFLCILYGSCIFLGSFFSLPICILFQVYMTHFQIKPEEKALEKLFGDEFLKYKKSVRRWI